MGPDLKPFTDPRTGKAMRAIDRVAFAVATLQGGGYTPPSLRGQRPPDEFEAFGPCIWKGGSLGSAASIDSVTNLRRPCLQGFRRRAFVLRSGLGQLIDERETAG